MDSLTERGKVAKAGYAPHASPPVLLGCLSAKGGQGASLFSLYLSALASRRRRTLLIDLDNNSTHRHFLDSPNCPGLANLAMVIGEIGPAELEGFIKRHPAGPDCIPGPRNPEEAKLLADADLRPVFEYLSGSYELLVADISSNLRSSGLQAASLSSVNFLLVQPDLLSLRSSIGVIDSLCLLSGSRQETALVVNGYGPSNILRPEQMAATVQLPLVAVLPQDGRLGDSFSALCADLHSDSAYHASLARLAASLGLIETSPRNKRSILRGSCLRSLITLSSGSHGCGFPGRKYLSEEGCSCAG